MGPGRSRRRLGSGRRPRHGRLPLPAHGERPGGGTPRQRTIELGPARFDAATGRIRGWGALELDGPWIDLHRAPTENDHGQGDLNDIASVWAATGMNRLVHRVDDVTAGDGWLRTSGRTAPSTHPHGVTWSMTWDAEEDGLTLTVEAEPVGPWADTPYLHRDMAAAHGAAAGAAGRDDDGALVRTRAR